MLEGKTIVVGVCGGIASYKAITLCSMLVKAGATVKVMMTASATQFVTPLTFQTITRQPVYTDTFEEREAQVISHIDLADHADLVIIAPATANMIAKMATGIADDMISTTLLATTAQVWIAPAMNVHMLAHPAVQRNLDLLQARGVTIIEPGEGLLACGYTGKGRLSEPEQLFDRIMKFFCREMPLRGKKVLVTAGGTRERIDPVRYIGNDSSGKMGFAVAKAAQLLGADVTLISANTQLDVPVGVRVIEVESAQEMFDQVMQAFPASDVIVKSAAVADYRPVRRATHKMKKGDSTWMIELEKTPDILETIGKRKTHQFIIGFAAETQDVERHAMSKLTRKNCDLIVANDVSKAGSGFHHDTNIVDIYGEEGLVCSLPLSSKTEIAEKILNIACERMERMRDSL